MDLIKDRFEIDGIAYVVDTWGVVRQEDLTPRQSYDREYVASRYDALPDRGRGMSFLRAGFIIGVIGQTPRKILDIGYGNGSFLDVMRLYGCECYGYDVSGYPLNHGSKVVTWHDVLRQKWQLVTAFDALEHMPDLSFLGSLKTDYLAVTAPYFPGREKFTEWRHRRPGEHLWAFTPGSLYGMLQQWGYRPLLTCSIEDSIRKPLKGYSNTFTSVFRGTPMSGFTST